MEKPNLAQKAYWIGTTSWVVFLVTLAILLVFREPILMNEITSPTLKGIIMLFMGLTIVLGGVSIIGLIFAIVAYQHDRNQTREFIINSVLNLSYVVLDLFLVLYGIKKIFIALMGV